MAGASSLVPSRKHKPHSDVVEFFPATGEDGKFPFIHGNTKMNMQLYPPEN